MPRRSRSSSVSRSEQVLVFGPPLGVRNSRQPFDDNSTAGDYCQNARNCAFVDPSLLSGAQARPGVEQFTNTSGNGGQGMHLHVMTNGTVYNFIVSGGTLQRLDPGSFPATVDVTPAAPIGIASGLEHPVSFLSLGDSMVVSDGVNRPWLATNLGSTPVTGTNIQINAASDAWSAGPPTIYQDSVCFPTITVPGGSPVTAGEGFVYSEPNQPLVGYTQTGYADFFNVIEQNTPLGSQIIYGLHGTNDGLFYFRQNALGMLAGSIANFSTTATRDARSSEIGTTLPWTIRQYANNIFFADSQGRPWMMPLDGGLQPIWKQMTAVVEGGVPANGTASGPAIASATIVPEFNAYAVASFLNTSPAGFEGRWLQEFDVFDGLSGNYFGRWSYPTSSTSPPIDANLGVIASLGVLAYPVSGFYENAPVLAILGAVGGAAGDAVLMLSPQQSGSVWGDQLLAATYVPPISVTTDRLGYSANLLHAPDLGTIITQHDTRQEPATNVIPMTIRMTTPYAADQTIATAATPNASTDGTYRTVQGFDGIAARDIQLTISPNTVSAPTGDPSTVQWSFQRLELQTTVSNAGPGDA